MPNNAASPSNKTVDPSQSVHQNVSIEANDFKLLRGPAVYAKATKGLTIKDNTFTLDTTFRAPWLDLVGCQQITVNGNKDPLVDVQSEVWIRQMVDTEVIPQPDFTLEDKPAGK